MNVIVKNLLIVLAGRDVAKWLRERALYVPDAKIVKDAAILGITPLQWRAVESTIADNAIAAFELL